MVASTTVSTLVVLDEEVVSSSWLHQLSRVFKLVVMLCIDAQRNGPKDYFDFVHAPTVTMKPLNMTQARMKRNECCTCSDTKEICRTPREHPSSASRSDGRVCLMF